jgi:hypothetical protein
MIKIAGHIIERKEDIQKTVKEVFDYARNANIIIVDEDDRALSESEILHLVSSNGQCILNVKSVEELEKETRRDILEYIDQASDRINKLLEETDRSTIYSAFSEMIESLLYLQKASHYFGFSLSSDQYLKELSQKALDQMTDDNESYLLDLLEYECQPLLLKMKESLEKWEIN